MRTRRWAAVAVGFAGALLVIRPGRGLGDPAVLLLCKTFLMLAGYLQPSDLRRLPLEIVLFDKPRRQNVSFRTAPFGV